MSRNIVLTDGIHEEAISMEDAASGLYILKVNQGGSTQMLKIIIE